MAGMLKFFGAGAALGGAIMAVVIGSGPVIPDGRGGSWHVIYAAAWLLGGLFWMALCLTIANISDKLDDIQAMTGKPSVTNR